MRTMHILLLLLLALGTPTTASYAEDAPEAGEAEAKDAASAEEEDDEDDSDHFVYARPGFYAGIGGTTAFPAGWDSDFDRDLNDDASAFADASAEANSPPGFSPSGELALVVDGADLEDPLLGINGVIGYRVAERVAFELEGEWLIDSSKSNFDISGSTGSHKVEVEEVWALTANLRMFLPFDWRIQPSAIVGVGIHHSKLDVDIVTSGLTTSATRTTPPPPVTIPVSADFAASETRTKLTGVVRLGGGIDVYATQNFVAQLNTTYVLPFDEVGSIMTADYVSLSWRLIYRF